MSEHTDSRYEELYPKTSANITYPSSATLSLLGLSENSTVDDALAKLSLGAGKYGYAITLIDSSGKPLSGVHITGVDELNGGELLTDDNGYCLGVSLSKNVTISSVESWIDLSSFSVNVNSTGIVTEVNITLERKNEITITSSQDFCFSQYCYLADFCIVGGGGGGSGQSGGGGGYVANLLSHSVSQSQKYNIIIGSGGSGNTINSNGNNGAQQGGSTKLTMDSNQLLIADGGKAGNVTAYSDGTGNGDGAEFMPGGGQREATDGVGYKFDNISLGLIGGGGGGLGRTYYSYAGNYNTKQSSLGGSPFGGHGSDYQNGNNARGWGGGGGGAYSNIAAPSFGYGGKGEQGVLFIRPYWN